MALPMKATIKAPTKVSPAGQAKAAMSIQKLLGGAGAMTPAMPKGKC